jgi:hypothetical protein
MHEQSTNHIEPSRPRRRDLLVGGGALAAAAGVAAVSMASPAGAVTPTPIPAYLPFGPQRVYDSRDGDGPIHSGFSRILGPDDPPPDTDIAYTYNLTVTNTAATGYLGVFSADISWPGNSSINWFGPGQLIANNVYTAFDATGAIELICGGGGSTDFVLDLVAISTILGSAVLTSIADVRARDTTSYVLSQRK